MAKYGWPKERESKKVLEEEINSPVPEEGWELNTGGLEEKAVILTDDAHSTSYSKGARMGPTNAAARARRGRSPANLFIAFLAVVLLEDIAIQTNKYGNKDWVTPAKSDDDDFSEASDSTGEDEKSITCVASKRKGIVPCRQNQKMQDTDANIAQGHGKV